MEWTELFYTVEKGRTLLRAMPLLLGALCVIAIAYRYYSAFLAAKVAALDDSRETPAHRFNDGQNYHPTSKWVLFGHHFAAISGAGPLIGPVLAIQYGYMPGLLWLVIGVCLAGAVQDMLVLAASVRRGGKSLAEIARAELGPWASLVVSAAILFIVVIALAGLGFVVVKALGGEDVKLAAGMRISVPPEAVKVPDERLTTPSAGLAASVSGLALYTAPRAEVRTVGEEPGFRVVEFDKNCRVKYTPSQAPSLRSEGMKVRVPVTQPLLLAPQPSPAPISAAAGLGGTAALEVSNQSAPRWVIVPPGCSQLIKGSSWGTFTIACTIPIALLVGLWMYRIRKGKVVEASLVGAALVLAATVAGNWVPGSPLEPFFTLSRGQTTVALCVYGFVAAVLPVWVLLAPRDYLSSFLKIGTIALLVLGLALANPALPEPPLNQTWLWGGPTFRGAIFPFVFICIMCGAVSGFHALVSSGTTPKMVDKESHIRPIGYGAMLMEGIVGLTALFAAASLPLDIYNDMNVDVAALPQFQDQLNALYKEYGLDVPEARDPMHQAGVPSLGHLRVEKAKTGELEEMVGESLRGRTGGAPTLAVGMARVFTQSLNRFGVHAEWLMRYWYHFAIMFEALFILTTIDAGTRIARFMLQETLGKLHPKLGQPDWAPGAVMATLIVTVGWGALVYTGSIDTIWPMFGIANQLLAVLALALLTTLLINTGRARYAWVTLLPMLFVATTTMSAGVVMVGYQFPQMMAKDVTFWKGLLSFVLTLFVVLLVWTLVFMAAAHWVYALRRRAAGLSV